MQQQPKPGSAGFRNGYDKAVPVAEQFFLAAQIPLNIFKKHILASYPKHILMFAKLDLHLVQDSIDIKYRNYSISNSDQCVSVFANLCK